MKKDSARVFLCTGLRAVIMAGTGLTGLADTAEVGNMQQMQGRGIRQDDRGVMMKIAAVISSTLIVVMAEEPEMQNNGTMPEKPADGEISPEKLTDEESLPEKPGDGETLFQRQGGQMEQKEMNFSDEESSLTLTPDIAVTEGMDHEPSSVFYLVEGSVVRLVLDGTTTVNTDTLE